MGKNEIKLKQEKTMASRTFMVPDALRIRMNPWLTRELTTKKPCVLRLNNWPKTLQRDLDTKKQSLGSVSCSDLIRRCICLQLESLQELSAAMNHPCCPKSSHRAFVEHSIIVHLDDLNQGFREKSAVSNNAEK